MWDSRKDFLISHYKTDQKWAEWIAWQLEQANYSIILPSRDIRPGEDFVIGKQKAFEVSERIIGVFSPDYLNDPETTSEWTAAFHDKKLLPVRIRECKPPGLLGPILYIDLVGREEPEARAELLSGVILGPVGPKKTPPYPGGASPIWNIPNVNLFFEGREEDLIYLQQVFTTYRGEAVPLQIVSGLGGIGKTQIAIRYAHKYRNIKYKTGLWVNAYTDKMETLRSGIISLAKLLDLPEKDKQNQDTVDAVIRWLEDENHSDWLLIFDNVETPDMVDDYIPLKGKGHILLTTRTQIMGKPYKRTEIDKLKPDEGALFLLNRAGITPSANGDFSPKDYELAVEIFRLMDGHPLALDQAGAFIQETNCGLERYLVIYREQRTKLLNRRGKFPFEHPDPVATTWLSSFESVKQTGRVGQVAYDILQLCAFLHPDAIPEEIISEGAPAIGNDLEEAIAILREFTLIRRDPYTKMLIVHCLVQTVLRDQMDTATRRQWAEQAVRSVHQVLPESKSVTLQACQCQKYFSHVQACAAHIDEWGMRFIEARQLLYRMGCHLQEHSQDAYSTPIFINGLSIWEKTQKGESPP